MSRSSESELSFAPKISKAAINDLEMIAWSGPVEVLETIPAMEQAVARLADESLLGFDTETRPTFKKGEFYPPALIQLAASDCVYLFRVSQTGTLKPLIPLLESAAVLKTGVAIANDVRELRDLEDFKPGGFHELTHLSTQRQIEQKGLRGLAAIVLNGRISKAAQVSNWAAKRLSSKQIRYAATDAWISREIYLRLDGSAMEPSR